MIPRATFRPLESISPTSGTKGQIMAGDNAKKALVDALNGALANHFALYMKTKNFHWHVSGPRFRDLHLLFDEQALQILGVTDLIAERVRKNGGDTLTSI